MIKYVKGSIWWANLEGDVEDLGHAVKKTRPVIIVSRNDFNASHPTVTVLPLTRKAPDSNKINPQLRPAIKTSLPYEKDEFSYAMCDQIRLVDKKILDDYYGFLDEWELVNVDVALQHYLGMEKVDGEIADVAISSAPIEE